MQRQVAYLVEKQRATVGLLNQTLAVSPGVGERTFDMAKQLAFKQRVGNGTHVDTHHRFRHAGRQAVKLMGEHILPRAVFASNQHIGVGA